MKMISRGLLAMAGGFLVRGGRARFEQESSRVEIKLVSKKEFVQAFVENSKDNILLIVYDTSRLKRAEGLERERQVIQVGKDLGQQVHEGARGVKVMLLKEEDYRIIEKSWESTMKSPKPIELEGLREAHVYFKRQGFPQVFHLSDEAQLSQVGGLQEKFNQQQLTKRVLKLAHPVVEVRTEAELRRELVRSIGCSNRPLVVDVCDQASFHREHESLQEYMLTRLHSKMIPRETKALLIDAKLLEKPAVQGKVAVVKNDFMTLHSLQKECVASGQFNSPDPRTSADWFARHLRGMLVSSLYSSTANFCQGKSASKFLDSEVLPEVPIFSEACPDGADPLFNHLFQNKGAKVLSLNLLKEDPLARPCADLLYSTVASKRFSGGLAFQVFAEGAYSKYLRHLNKYYSPFCVYDIDHAVKNSHQKLFVPTSLGMTLAELHERLKFVLERSQSASETDLVRFGNDSFLPVSSVGYSHFRAKDPSKRKILLLTKKGCQASLLYERHLLHTFGGDEHTLLAKMEFPNVIPKVSKEVAYPALVFLSPDAAWEDTLFELPTDLSSQADFDRVMVSLGQAWQASAGPAN